MPAWALLGLVAAPAPLGVAAPATAQAPAPLPDWWRAATRLPRLEARFTQVSQSEVFGKLERRGRLWMAAGGRLRVAYDSGLLLVADGRDLITYDPEARTAQRLVLRSAVEEMPLLNLLLDPGALPDRYTLEAAPGGAVRLRPRKPGPPEVLAEGKGQAPTRLRWKDGTGAAQELVLQEARVPAAALPAATFRFAEPKGTRWLK
jgi:outer membrane lipoprotein-sorting protein